VARPWYSVPTTPRRPVTADWWSIIGIPRSWCRTTASKTAALGAGQGEIEEIYANLMKAVNAKAGPRAEDHLSPEAGAEIAARIGLMREAGKLVAEALRVCRSLARPV